MNIIDSHVHFWDTHRAGYDWLGGVPEINHPFIPADFRAASAGFDVRGIVFVECGGGGLEEVKWVTTLVNDVPVRGIVAYVPLEDEDARSELESLTAYTLVKGIRRNIQSEAAGFAAQENFIRGVRAVADYGFSFDICIYHHQLPDVLKLVDACPDVPFVLDHVGKPGIAAGEIDAWRAGITALAQYPNVSCKLSGMVTEADHAAWTPDGLRPYVEHVLESFGTHRLMFGSDWPVVTLASTYSRWLQTAQNFLSDLSTDEQEHIFYHNVRRFYRLES